MIKKKTVEEDSLFAITSAPAETSSKTETKEKTEEKTALRPQEEAAIHSWKEKYYEFDLTKPSQFMKDTMKEDMLKEGFGKREANKVFKGLFFKEKVCNTKDQALEYLETIPTSYAVKYKIGIQPSPKMISLEKRLKEKRERLKTYKKEQNQKKFDADFVSCTHCKSRINRTFITPPLCPVCGEDMRSDTVVKTLTTLEETVKDLKKKYEDTARKHNSKFTGGEKWIIRLVNPMYEE